MNRTLLTAALVIALPVAAFAAPRGTEDPQAKPSAPPAMQERMQHRMERAAEFLKLTDAQKASIKAIHEKNQDGAKTRREAAQAAGKAFREAAQDPKVSTDQLRRLHQAAADARFDALSTHRAMMLEIRNLLTPEQREKAATLRGMGLERRRERMMRMRGGPRDGMGRGMGHGRGEGFGPGRQGRPEGRPGFED
jgi:Spy/CpxP family protein refolding chaperone